MNLRPADFVADPLAPLATTSAPFARPIVVFDLDGTLVDTAPDLTASLNHCLRSAGHRAVPIEAVRPHAGKGVRAMLDAAYGAIGLELTPAQIEEQTACFLAYYESHIADHSAPFPGTRALLERLSAAGYALAICTNKAQHLSERLLGELGLLGHFPTICGADAFPRRKPDPMHLLGTVERAGGDRARAVMIGDSRADIDAAIASFVPSILVDFGYGADEATRARADRIVTSFREIDAALIERMVERPALAC